MYVNLFSLPYLSLVYEQRMEKISYCLVVRYFYLLNNQLAYFFRSFGSIACVE